jgi:hypothetical protein
MVSHRGFQTIVGAQDAASIVAMRVWLDVR